MTKIIVDKQTALRAVCKYFDIEWLGTPLSNKVGNIVLAQNIEIEFDFDNHKKQEYYTTHKTIQNEQIEEIKKQWEEKCKHGQD